MNNPLARLIGQAETSLADISRRTAASIAAPIKAKSQEVIAEVSASVATAAKTVLIKAVLGLVAGVMLIIAIGYATSAGYWALLPILGPVETRLVMAGAFAGIAVIAILAMVFWPGGGSKAKAATDKAKVEAEAVAAQAAARRAMAEAAAADDASPAMAAGNADLKSGVEAMAAILGEAGFRREQAGLRTGLALASQLKPMQIVSLALIGGYVFGLRSSWRRRG